jgi:hypothetical protein
MAKKHGSNPGCFESGVPGHFITNYPKRNAYYTNGNGSGLYDSGSPFKPSDYKFRPRKGSHAKNFMKVIKDYQKESKRWEKAFMAKVEDQFVVGDTSSSSSSSSSDEEVVIKKGGKKDAGGL